MFTQVYTLPLPMTWLYSYPKKDILVKHLYICGPDVWPAVQWIGQVCLLYQSIPDCSCQASKVRLRLNSLVLVDIGVASQLFLRAPVHFLPSNGSLVLWGNLHVWFRFRPHLPPPPHCFCLVCLEMYCWGWGKEDVASFLFKGGWGCRLPACLPPPPLSAAVIHPVLNRLKSSAQMTLDWRNMRAY